MNSERIGSKIPDVSLTEEQYEELEKLSALNYEDTKIALYFNIPIGAVRKALKDKDSEFFFHHSRGILMWQARADMQVLSQAEMGNITAYQIYKKESFFQKLDSAKKRIIYKEELSELDELQNLMSKGSADLTPDKEEYYLQLDMVRRLFDKYESKNIILNTLRKSYKLNLSKALQIYSDAINFFYLDNDIKPEAWANIYADRLDNVALLCLEMNEFDIYRKFVTSAAKMRGVGKETPMELPADFYDRKPVLYTIDPKLLGLEKVNRNRLAAWIDELPDISDDDRTRLHREAMDGKATQSLFDESLLNSGDEI